jgi:hypothetical protein
MKVKLPNNVASTQDLTSLLIEIREYSKWYYHESIKKRVNAKRSSESPALSPAAIDLLRDWKSRTEISNQSLEELIKTLEDYCTSAPGITITLAATPSSSLKNALVSWCRENISPDILVAFKFNATILGGMVVKYGSRVFDWSFRRQIMEKRQAFPEILRRV